MQGKSIFAYALTAVLCLGTFASGQDSKNEVHLVGIYEGFEQTGNKIHGPKALVHVDRPGKQVTLVLTSYSGATWYVSTSDGTQIQKVILGGHEQQAVEGLPKSTEVVKAWRGQPAPVLYFVYEPVGPQFRRLVKQIHAVTKMELSSFHGGYRPNPDRPFLIDRIQGDPKLSADYPKPTPPAELPEDVRDLTFFAHYYVAGRYPHELTSAFGKYTLNGPVDASLKPLPKGVNRLASNSIGKTPFGISGHNVVQIDADTNEVKQVELSLNVPRLSWPCEITYDTKRKRVILGSSGGGGYLYAYSTESQQWSVISKRPNGLDAFVYSPEDDFIYGVSFEHGENGDHASLAKVNSEGAVISRTRLASPIEPGCLNGGPGVCTTQVAIAGKYIVILASPGGVTDRNKLDAASIYLVDPEKQKVWLTFRKLADK